MSEPLIVVEGNLRLPSLRPLADPRLKFGREWSIAQMRPARTRTGSLLYGATLETAYVRPPSLPTKASHYRPLSIWGLFPEASARRTPRVTASSVVLPAAVAPITLKVHAPNAVQPLEFRFPRLLKAAIALGCVALVAWLVVANRTPAAEDVHHAAKRFEGARAVAPVAAVVDLPKPASSLAALVPVMASATLAAHPASAPATIPTASDRAAPTAITIAIDNAAPPRANAGGKRTEHASHASHTSIRRPAAHVVASRAHAMDYASGGIVNVTDPMTTQALYSLLQHSPTLDSNADTAR